MSKNLHLEIVEQYITANEIKYVRGDSSASIQAKSDYYGNPIILENPLKGKAAFISNKPDDHYETQAIAIDLAENVYAHPNHAVVLFFQGLFKEVPFYATFSKSLSYPDSKIKCSFTTYQTETNVFLDTKIDSNNFKLVSQLRSAIRNHSEKSLSAFYEMNLNEHEDQFFIRNDMTAQWVVAKINAREKIKRDHNHPINGLWQFDSTTKP
jgi:hypothetical protein